jgi:hypothetical protein
MNTAQPTSLNLHHNQLPTIHHQTVNFNSNLFSNNASNPSQQHVTGFSSIPIKNINNSNASIPLMV